MNEKCSVKDTEGNRCLRPEGHDGKHRFTDSLAAERRRVARRDHRMFGTDPSWFGLTHDDL